MRFNVRVFDQASGQVRKLSAEASDESEVRLQLSSIGSVVVSVHSAAGRFGPVLPVSVGRFDAALFCNELARLLRAGLTLPEAVQTQSGRVAGASRAVYSDLQARLLEGKRLSNAMRQVDAFPSVLIAAVQASERSGRVPEALEEFARYNASLQELRRKLINAAIYPILVVGFGLLVSLFLLGYVVPRFARIFSERVAQTSNATGFLIHLGQAINDHPFRVGIAILVVVGLMTALLSDRRFRQILLTLAERIGPIARWVGNLQRARITYSMAMLLKNGFPMPEAMGLASAQATRPDLAAAMRSATQAIESGQSTSSAWHSSGMADSYAIRILQAGERTGNLATCFETLAQTYRTDVETTLERAGRIAEPLLLVIVAVLIGLIVVLMYMPIFDLATSVG